MAISNTSLNHQINEHSNVSSPHQSATSSITESPESFESTQLNGNQSNNTHNNNNTDIDMDQIINGNLEEEQKRNLILDKLYQLIEAVEPYLVAKITGMIIHKQSTDKLLKLLLNEKLLYNKITQATKLLTRDNNESEYGILYQNVKYNCQSTKAKREYLRNKLYPKVEAYVSQKNLADIITDMLLQLNVSEIFVLLNQQNTLKKRMDEAIKAYLQANAVHIHAINEFNEYQSQN